jgi:hypothetical protein
MQLRQQGGRADNCLGKQALQGARDARKLCIAAAEFFGAVKLREEKPRCGPHMRLLQNIGIGLCETLRLPMPQGLCALGQLRVGAPLPPQMLHDLQAAGN